MAIAQTLYYHLQKAFEKAFRKKIFQIKNYLRPYRQTINKTGVIQLIIAFTDDNVRLQYAAQYSNDVKRLEKFHSSMMRSFCDIE